MTNTTPNAASYRITTRREHFGCHGDCWVARDDSGTWRGYARYNDGRWGTTAAEATRNLFHADELTCLEDHGDHATARILEG